MPTMSAGNPAAKKQLPSSSSAYVKHSVTTCGRKSNLNSFSIELENEKMRDF